MSVTPEQYQKNLKSFQQEIANLILNAPFAASTDLMGKIVKRIFNNGLATDESDIGRYAIGKRQTFLTNKVRGVLNKRQLGELKKEEFLSTNKKGDVEGISYIALRNLAGRRIDKVDLQFTGALFESIKNGIGSEEGTAIIGFNNSEESKIARYNEKHFKKEIFKPSTTEQEEAKQFMIDFIREGIKDKAKSILNG